MCIQQLEEGRAEVENQYTRSVRPEGNQVAQRLIREVFQVIPRKWRGVGQIVIAAGSDNSENRCLNFQSQCPRESIGV
jgi:hydrogenase expression/formation protein HypD